MADAGLLRLYTQLEWVKVCVHFTLHVSISLFICPFYYVVFPFQKEMLSLKNEMRNDDRENWTYQDNIFYNEINKAIAITAQNYEKTLFRDAVKSGFYDLQVQ